MRWKDWLEEAKKPATITVTGLIGMVVCMIASCTNVIMYASVALFTAGVSGLTDQRKRQSNR